MKYRLTAILIISSLIIGTNVLCAVPNLYMLSLFTSESLTSSANSGGRITLGFGNEDLYGTTSLRLQHPDTTMSAHLTKRIHGKNSLLTGNIFGNISYFSHEQYNGSASLLAAYALSLSSPFKNWPTRITAGLGVQGTTFWSKSYDANLLSITPHFSFSLGQTLFDRLALNLFVTTETLCLQESNVSFYYGLSLALAVTENLILHVRPLIRLSDYTNESMFVIFKEISCSLCWTSTKQTIQELGVWL